MQTDVAVNDPHVYMIPSFIRKETQVSEHLAWDTKNGKAERSSNVPECQDISLE